MEWSNSSEMLELLESKGLIDDSSEKVLTIPPYFQYYFSVFNLLNLSRGSGFAGIEPIKIGDILALRHIDPQVRDMHFVHCISTIDREFRKLLDDRRDKQTKR